MASRLDGIDKTFRNLPSKPHVYFQPPSSVQMTYPAIKYSLYDIDNTPADDVIYKQSVGYQAIVIDTDPDSEVVKEVSKLPGCRFDRAYVADNLNHTSFIIYS